MSNWEPGDLALCVRTGELSHYSPGGVRCTHGGGKVPPLGSVRKVVRVKPALTDRGTVFRCGCLDLVFSDGSLGAAMRFTKVTPGADVKGIEEPKKLHEWGLTTSTNCFTGKSSATETTNDRPHRRPRSPQALS